MKRLVTVVTLAILLVGLVLFGLSDNFISVADTSIPDNEVVSNEAYNSSAPAIITITRTGVLDDAVQYSYEDEIPASIAVSNVDNRTSYNITLATGWNLISLPLIPDNTSIANVTAGIAADVAIIWGYSGNTTAWHWYVPGNPSSTLTSMEDGLGYWVFMNSPATLNVTGQEILTPTPPCDVFDGWNLIGFTSTTSMSPETYLAGVAADYTIIWGYDAEGQTWLWNTADNSSSTLANMESGHGYWLWATVDGTCDPIIISGCEVVKISEPFWVHTEEWTIDWYYVPRPVGKTHTFICTVYRRGQTRPIMHINHGTGITSGSTYIYAGPGEYYMRAMAVNIMFWHVTIKPA